MAYLIYTDYDVGGLPTYMASVLHDAGISMYFINVSIASGHDSGEFHYGKQYQQYDITTQFPSHNEHKAFITKLKEVKLRYGIQRAFGVGVSSWMLHEAGIPYDYWTYGADVDMYISEVPYAYWNSSLPLELLSVRHKVIREYRNIVCANEFWKKAHRGIHSTLSRCERIQCAPYQKKMIKRFVSHIQFFQIPHILEQVEKESLEKLTQMLPPQLSKKRYIISICRHDWTGLYTIMTDYKANQKALYGFARYVKESHDHDLYFVLINKGSSVEASRQLALKLGISDRLIWLEQMPRDDLAALYAGAIVALGNFGTPVLSGSALESLAFGTPCISSYMPTYFVDPPVINARTPQQIACALHDIVSSPMYRERLSQAGLAWVREYCSKEKFITALLS